VQSRVRHAVERTPASIPVRGVQFTNTPYFSQPGGPNTVTINAADELRRIQFALKYSY
jgi:hypothetical protein